MSSCSHLPASQRSILLHVRLMIDKPQSCLTRNSARCCHTCQVSLIGDFWCARVVGKTVVKHLHSIRFNCSLLWCVDIKLAVSCGEAVNDHKCWDCILPFDFSISMLEGWAVSSTKGSCGCRSLVPPIQNTWLANRLPEASDQLIKWSKSDVLLLGWS